MLYLATAAIFCTLFGVLFKICQLKDLDVPRMVMYGYFTAAIICIALALGITGFDGIGKCASTLSTQTYLLGILQGILYLTGFLIGDGAVWRSGVTLYTIATRASVILPLIFCWLILDEAPPSWIGLALVLIAMLLIIVPNNQQEHRPEQRRSKTEAIRRRKAILSLVFVFLFTGISDFMLKVTQSSSNNDGVEAQSIADPNYLLLLAIIFGGASIASLLYCAVTKRLSKNWKPLSVPDKEQSPYPEGYWRHELKWGIFLGVSNVGCTASILQALNILPSSIFFSAYNISIVTLSCIAGIALFHEKIQKLQYIGIALAIAAIVVICT